MSNLARKNEKRKEQPKKLNLSTYGAFHQTVEICRPPFSFLTAPCAAWPLAPHSCSHVRKREKYVKREHE
jgi:hypothetical protein